MSTDLPSRCRTSSSSTPSCSRAGKPSGAPAAGRAHSVTNIVGSGDGNTSQSLRRFLRHLNVSAFNGDLDGNSILSL